MTISISLKEEKESNQRPINFLVSEIQQGAIGTLSILRSVVYDTFSTSVVH